MAAKLQTVTNDCTINPSTESVALELPPQWHAKIRRSATLSRGALPSRSYDFIHQLDSLLRRRLRSALVAPGRLPLVNSDACVEYTCRILRTRRRLRSALPASTSWPLAVGELYAPQRGSK